MLGHHRTIGDGVVHIGGFLSLGERGGPGDRLRQCSTHRRIERFKCSSECRGGDPGMCLGDAVELQGKVSQCCMTPTAHICNDGGDCFLGR